MEGGVCGYQKYGFCKYKEGCTKKHLEDICTDLSLCRNSKNCQKRHPRECKRYSLERFCRFGEGCAYHHKEQSKFLEESDITEINMKVDELKKVVHEMSEKIGNLESKVRELESKDELKDIKESPKTAQEPFKNSNMKKDSDDIPLKKSEPKKNKDSVFRFGAEARKTVSDRIESQEKERSKKEFKCELCEYSCEKFATLKKHINSKHTEQKS